MNGPRSTPLALLVALVACIAMAASCAGGTTGVPADHLIPLGTWGGEGGGLIVGDTSMHLHVGCTYGDVSGRVPVDAEGRFDVAGSYMLRAYPITVGPTVPARFTGHIDGDRITITATVDDTVTHQTVVRGPVDVTLDVEPRLGTCPICRRPNVPSIRRPASWRWAVAGR